MCNNMYHSDRNVHGNIYIYIYIYVYIRLLYIHTHIPTHIHTHVRTYVHTYIHTYLHTYIRTYIQNIYIRLRHGQEILVLSTMSRPALRSTQPLSIGYMNTFLAVKWQGSVLTTHLHLAPMLRMNGAILLILLYALMVWAETSLLFTSTRSG
jgi:hypothetical protein